MTLLVTEIESMVKRRLGGKPSMPLLRLINTAGAYLVNAHEWEWTRRPAKLLSISAGAEWISLPSDFGQIISIQSAGVLTGNYIPVSPDVLDAKRSSIPTGGTGVGIYGCLGYRQNTATGTLSPVLEIWPVQDSDQDDALRLRYRARWTEVRSESAAIPIPNFPDLEAVFVDMVIACAQGQDEHDVASRGARLSEIVQGPDFAAAVAMDSGAVDTLGPIENGASSNTAFQGLTFWG